MSTWDFGKAFLWYGKLPAVNLPDFYCLSDLGKRVFRRRAVRGSSPRAHVSPCETIEPSVLEKTQRKRKGLTFKEASLFDFSRSGRHSFIADRHGTKSKLPWFENAATPLLNITTPVRRYTNACCDRYHQ